MRPSEYQVIREFRNLAGDILDFCLSLEKFFPAKKKMNGHIATLAVPESLDFCKPRMTIIFAVYCTSINEQKDLDSNISEALTASDVLYVVNTGPFLLPHSSKYIVINRENIARDLGSYAVGIKLLKNLPSVYLVLINDSVHWLPGSISNFIQLSTESTYEITSVTASNQGGFHLQSYALLFKKPTIELLSPVLNMKSFRFKRNLVRYGELRFSRFWHEKNIPMGPVWNIASETEMSEDVFIGSKQDLLKLIRLTKAEVPLNPSIHYWPWLMRDMKIVKKSLLKHNPAKFSDHPKIISATKK